MTMPIRTANATATTTIVLFRPLFMACYPVEDRPLDESSEPSSLPRRRAFQRRRPATLRDLQCSFPEPLALPRPPGGLPATSVGRRGGLRTTPFRASIPRAHFARRAPTPG